MYFSFSSFTCYTVFLTIVGSDNHTFGEVWGIGPATALRLYEKGYRTLDDLQKEESLTHAQKLGLKYFDDIKQRIPRNEVGYFTLVDFATVNVFSDF